MNKQLNEQNAPLRGTDSQFTVIIELSNWHRSPREITELAQF